jgi:hypothetical protein
VDQRRSAPGRSRRRISRPRCNSSSTFPVGRVAAASCCASRDGPTRREILQRRRWGARPTLVVSIDTSVTATLPVWRASRRRAGRAWQAHGRGDGGRMRTGRGERSRALNLACAYPTPCTCTVVDVPGQPTASIRPCACLRVWKRRSPTRPARTSTPTFPGLRGCRGTVETCKSFVAATNVSGDSPVCVASGQPVRVPAFRPPQPM